MTQVLAIAAGGAMGALMRYWLSNLIYECFGRGFPWGTLVVNVLGSLVMGVLFVIMTERTVWSPELRLGLMTGLLGALTTFSTFSLESVALLESGRFGMALSNAALSVVVCIAACWLGMLLARSLS
jgi:CrcB protein